MGRAGLGPLQPELPSVGGACTSPGFGTYWTHKEAAEIAISLNAGRLHLGDDNDLSRSRTEFKAWDRIHAWSICVGFSIAFTGVIGVHGVSGPVALYLSFTGIARHQSKLFPFSNALCSQVVLS